jgi:FkbM family methyltransferase
MSAGFLSFVRDRWHPLRKLRSFGLFRWVQNRFDLTIYKRVDGTEFKMAMKLVRDASSLVITLEPQVRSAFELILELTNPRVFWDVGANLGFYSWLVRQYPSVQQVVLFEPDPTNYELINKTISRNKVSDCIVKNLALSDRRGEARFLLDRASGKTGSLYSVANISDSSSLQSEYQLDETISSRTATVDDLVTEGLPAPDLMKIDVEGAEHLVLGGAETCLETHNPVLILETSNPKLLDALLDKGYNIFRIDEGNFLCVFSKRGIQLDRIVRAFGPVEVSVADRLPKGDGSKQAAA